MAERSALWGTNAYSRETCRLVGTDSLFVVDGVVLEVQQQEGENPSSLTASTYILERVRGPGRGDKETNSRLWLQTSYPYLSLPAT